MRSLKFFDFLISALLIITLTIFCFVKKDIVIVFLSYCIVGSWQVISMIVHAINNWFITEGSVRRLYHQIVLWIITIFFVCVLIENTILPGIVYLLMIFLYLLLVFAPIMAIFYTILCFMEWQDLRPKSMARLKY